MLPVRPLAPRASIPVDLPTAAILGDQRRLAAIPLPDTRVRAGLDHLAALAAHALEGDQAYVTLIDTERQMAVGGHGDRTDWPVASGFCAYTLALGEPLLLGDLLEDPIAAVNPSVAAGLRAYAGTVVRVDGERVGTLCVFSSRARAWTISDAERLTQLATLADHLLAG